MLHKDLIDAIGNTPASVMLSAAKHLALLGKRLHLPGGCTD